MDSVMRHVYDKPNCSVFFVVVTKKTGVLQLLAGWVYMLCLFHDLHSGQAVSRPSV